MDFWDEWLGEKTIPRNTRDIYDDELKTQNKFIVYREFMNEVSIEKLREILDSHWKEFEKIM